MARKELPAPAVASLQAEQTLWNDFTAICDCGGRVCGSPSEQRALGLLRRLGAAASGVPGESAPAVYAGWHCRDAALDLIADGAAVPLPLWPLLDSGGGSIEAEVLPLGRGALAEFEAARPALRGRIALVRHEFMFSAGHLHRRFKFDAAVRAGAAGFLIESPLAGSPVGGSAGREILAAGVSPEVAKRLSPPAGLARVRMTVDAVRNETATESLLFDIPGRGHERVVLSAHVDGHALAESALDNASGLAAALAVVRALGPCVRSAPRGLTLALFGAEEWGLNGSRQWLASLSPQARRSIVLNVNLDTVGGASELTALVSGFVHLGRFAREVTAASGIPVGIHLPLVMNSDHANFAADGIPALRLVAGFDDPASNLRHVLTAGDTRDKTNARELSRASMAAAALVWSALHADPADAEALRLSTAR